MTRKELAYKIATIEAERKGLNAKSLFKGLLYGSGYAKPESKASLESWYKRLLSETK